MNALLMLSVTIKCYSSSK